MITKEVLVDLPVAALSLPYERSEKDVFLEKDSEFEGMTNAEVMNVRLARNAAKGDMDAIKTLQDRVLGKPKQQIESRSITETYTQYLERLAAAEEEKNLTESIVEEIC
ncbi:MAG: hypothetical protein QGG97_00350 [Flavobacteriales bacterium]|jgi:hypothetical protein|nr:hypothetical protein [Flavobacteriales bacterium]